MAHDYEKSKKIVLNTILLLGVITICEVFFALLGKGYIVEGMHWPTWLMGILMIVLSLTKAVYIVFEFMHMKYELPGLAKTVLLPMFLLVWGVVAFLYEGYDWGDRRELIENKDKEKVEDVGFIIKREHLETEKEYFI